MSTFRRLLLPGRLLAALLAAALLAMVCGAGTPVSAAGSKQPVKIFVMGTFSSPTLALPGELQGAEAAASSINAKGGISGHKIVLLSCNDEQTPNQETACARKAVAAHVTAVVGNFILASQAFAVLTPAKIPVVDGDPISDPTPTASNSYPLNAGSDAAFMGAAEQMVKGGAKTLALIQGNLAPLEAVATSGIAGAKKAGGTVVNTATYTVGSPDFGPVVEQALAGGNVQGILYQGLPTTLPKVVLAASQAGFNGPIGMELSITSPAIIKELGAAANKLVLVNNFYNPPSKQAAGFVASIKKYQPTAQLTLTTQSSWAEVTAIAAALKGKSQMTAAALTKSFNSQTALNIGPYAPTINMTKPGPIPGSPRFFNPMVVAYKVKNGTYVAVGGFFNPYAK